MGVLYNTQRDLCVLVFCRGVTGNFLLHRRHRLDALQWPTGGHCGIMCPGAPSLAQCVWCMLVYGRGGVVQQCCCCLLFWWSIKAVPAGGGLYSALVTVVAAVGRLGALWLCFQAGVVALFACAATNYSRHQWHVVM